VKVLVPGRLGRGVRIAAMGAYLPERVVTNEDLVALGAPLSPEEMVRGSGIRERRWAASHEATSDLATAACRLALGNAGLGADAIERLVVGTVSPDHASPSTACFVHRALHLGRAPALDVTASCSGFLYALDVACRSVLTGDAAALACAADIRSRYLDVTDRTTCALFGDGAGAAVVMPAAPGEGILGIGLAADGEGAESVYVPAGGSRTPATAETVAARAHTIRMAEGPQVYLTAIEGMISAGESLLAALGRTWSDVDLVVPHQANRRVLERIAKLVKLPVEKIFIDIERMGNVSGAACAIAFDAAIAQGRISPGDHVLLLAAGAGYTAGAALVLADEDLLRRR